MTIDIHDLILDERDDEKDDVDDDNKGKKPTTKAKRPKVEYDVVLSSGVDFAIQRKTARTTRLLVCLVSQGQYYIKEADGSISPLTVDNMTAFMSDSVGAFDGKDGMEIDGCSWLRYVPRGKKQCEWFVRYLNDGGMVNAIRKGLVILDSFARAGYHGPNPMCSELSEFLAKEPDAATLANWCVVTMGKMYGMTREEVLMETKCQESRQPNVISMLPTLYSIAGRLGMDTAHTIFKNCLSMAVPLSLDVRRIDFDKYSFKPSVFADYVTYGALRQGYLCARATYDNRYWNWRRDAGDFTSEWIDVLDMQLDLYGKVKDKYPKNLATLHNQLVYLQRLRSVKIEQQKWDEMLPAMLKRQWKSDGYEFIAPKTSGDMVDEAAQQSNCLAGYIKRVSEGEVQIFFMRRSKTPDRSLITIEVTKDGRLGQVYGHCNRRPTEAETKVVNKWAEKFGIKVPDAPVPMHA